jgi:Domain of unknown function (DUF4276)
MKGVEIYIISEGSSEEKFIKEVIAPSFRDLDIYLKPIQLETSNGFKGGALNHDRLRINARNILNQYPKAYLSSLIDLYALRSDFPCFDESQKLSSPIDKAQYLATKLNIDLVTYVNCRVERVITHIQPYELEGLFFSNPQAISLTVPEWGKHHASLQAIRNEFETPEHINNSYEKKPSARLEKLLGYKKKALHASRIGQRVGLSTIEKECPHFAAWLQQLRDLKPL